MVRRLGGEDLVEHGAEAPHVAARILLRHATHHLFGADVAWGADDGAFLHLQRQRPKGTVVLGRLRIDQVGEGNHRGRIGIGIGGVDEARHLRMALTEVDLKVAAVLADACADRDVL